MTYEITVVNVQSWTTLRVKTIHIFYAYLLPAFSSSVNGLCRRQVSVAIRNDYIASRCTYLSRRGMGCIAHASSVLCRLSSGMRVPLLSDSRLVYLCIRVYASARDGITKFATNTVRQESFAVPLSGVMHTLERAEVTVDWAARKLFHRFFPSSSRLDTAMELHPTRLNVWKVTNAIINLDISSLSLTIISLCVHPAFRSAILKVFRFRGKNKKKKKTFLHRTRFYTTEFGEIPTAYFPIKLLWIYSFAYYLRIVSNYTNCITFVIIFGRDIIINLV